MDKEAPETLEQEIHAIRESVSAKSEWVSRRQLWIAAVTLGFLIAGSIFTAGSQFTSLTEGQDSLKASQQRLEKQFKDSQADRTETLKEWGDWRVQMSEDRAIMKTQLKAMSSDLKYIRGRLDK